MVVIPDAYTSILFRLAVLMLSDAVIFTVELGQFGINRLGSETVTDLLMV